MIISKFKKLIAALAIIGSLLLPTLASAERTFSLPDQTGHAGQFLKTDGQDPLWAATGGGGGPIDLTTDVTNVLPLNNGGLGSSLADPNADRILFWDDSAGQVTYLTAGTGLSISGTTISATTSSLVDSVNGLTGAVVLTTSDIAEGTNLYYTAARFNTAFAAKTTDDLTEGSTNKYNATHTGDVTGATALTITSGAVTNAKLADVATQTFKGRLNAGNGPPEDLTLAQTKTLLGISNTNTGDVTLGGENYLSIAGQVITAGSINLSGTNATGTLAAARFPALTGDVTNTVGTLATTIANSAVTFSKIQDISTNKLLGRSTAGTGNVEQLSIGSGLTLAGGTLSATGAVTSVSNADGTLTISPTTGAVVASLNQANNFAFTGSSTYSNTQTFNGTSAFNGAVTFTNLPTSSVTPTTSNQLINKAYADAIAASIDPSLTKLFCVATSNTNITIATALNNGDVINGVTLSTGDRVLVNGQTLAQNNGIYVVGVVPARATDSDTAAEVAQGTSTFVTGGTLMGSYLQLDVVNVLGTDPLAYTIIQGVSSFTGSLGVKLVGADFESDLSASGAITLSGNSMQVATDGSSIEINSNALRVKALGITNAMLAGSIADSKLSTITTAGKVSGAALTSLSSIPGGAGIIPVANLGSGTPTSAKYLAGDGTWTTTVSGVTGLTSPSGTIDIGGSIPTLTVDVNQITSYNWQSTHHWLNGSGLQIDSGAAFNIEDGAAFTVNNAAAEFDISAGGYLRFFGLDGSTNIQFNGDGATPLQTIWFDNTNLAGIGFRAPATMTSGSISYTWPAADANGVWKSNGSGVLSVGTVAINQGGTGQTTAANAINVLLPSQGGNSGKFLTTNGTVASWGTAGAGSGDFVGPASATDNAIVRFDTTTGKLGQDSGITVSDVAANNVTLQASASTDLTLSGGVAGAGGRAVNILGTTGAPTFPGGPIVITAGAGGSSTGNPIGGAVSITGGAGSSGAAAGGAINLTGGGGGSLTGVGGNINIKAGLNTTSGLVGSIKFINPVTTFGTIFNMANVATADKTITVPNAAGTLAISASGNIALSALGALTFTGTLPIASGGTNNSSAYTAGSVVFSNGTSLTQNNANFFWDNTNSRLGIGSSSPTAKLDLAASAAAASSLRIRSGTAPTSPNDGDIWFDSTAKTLKASLGGLTETFSGALSATTSNGAVTNTTTETTVLGTVSGSNVIAANSLAVGSVIRITAILANFTTDSTPGTMTIRFKLGSTTLNSIVFTPTASTSSGILSISDICTVRAIGASGSLICSMDLRENTTPAATAFFSSGTTTTLDTTASQTADLTNQWSIANANNSIAGVEFVMERVK